MSPTQSDRPGEHDEIDDLDLVEPPPTRCDSCGDEGEQLAKVRRIYVTPAGDGEPEAHRVVDEDEWWCFPCRTHYPHEVQPG